MKCGCGQCGSSGRQEFAVWRGEYVASVRETCETCGGTGEMWLCSECGCEVPLGTPDEYDVVREICADCAAKHDDADADAAKPSTTTPAPVGDSAALAGAVDSLFRQAFGH